MGLASRIILAAAISFSVAATEASAAFRLPGWACRAVFSRAGATKFSPSKFELAEERWTKELARDGEVRPLETVLASTVSPEEWLAYLEVVAKRSGSDLFDMRKFFSSDPARAQQFANELKRVVDSGELFSGKGTTRIIAELYAVSRLGNRPGWRKFVPLSAVKAIERRVVLDLERYSLEEAFRRIGILRDPTEIEKFRRWLGNHSYALNLPILAGTAALSATYLGKAFPVGGLQPLRWKQVPIEWRELYQRGGLEAIRPLFRREFGVLGNVDAAWRIFTAAAGVAALGVVTTYIILYPETLGYVRDWAAFGISLVFADLSPRGMQEYQEEHFDCAEERKKKVKSWNETYEAFEGRPLARDTDPEGWKEYDRQVLSAPCESFKVEYAP